VVAAYVAGFLCFAAGRWLRMGWRNQRGSGSFARTVRLPFRIEADKVSAKYERGILQITLPRAEEDKPKKIQIKSK